MDHRGFHLAAVHELVGDGSAWTGVLWGKLSGMPIVDLLSVLGHARRDGLLLVRGDDESERALGLLDGNVVWSASSEPAEQNARAMAFGLVRLQEGDFTFLKGPVPAADGPSAQEILLEGLRRLDEAQRLAG